MNAILYAIIAAVAGGFWSYFQRLASPNVNQLFGALVISITAVIVAATLLLVQSRQIQLYSNPRGIWFLVLAGVAAFSVDYFTLQAYSRGLPVSIGAPIGIAGGIATAVIIGLLIGENFSLMKFAGLLLIAGGGIILALYE
jgi:uncharacterized membrane protein